MEFRTTTLVLPDDYEGRVTATLIETHPDRPTEAAVLYLHGYSDYFFQTHFAARIVASGRSFYALDLRKYGRSKLPFQHPDYTRDMSEYYPEIDRAVDKMRADGKSDITLIGHSTGGLLAALYCADAPERRFINRLILNSPFLEFNQSWIVRHLVIPPAAWLSRVFPYIHTGGALSDVYFRSIHRSERGEWDFDTEMKPSGSVPLYFAWLRAVRNGQKRIKKGLGLTIPVLVMYSGASYHRRRWDEVALRSDTVLDVKQIARYALRLGDRVKRVSIDGGLHDLVLSRKEVRERVMDCMVAFMDDRPVRAEGEHATEKIVAL